MASSDPVVMFSDYACPWCYLGRARLRRALSLEAEQGEGAPRQAVLLPFPLSPDTPPEGRDAVRYLSSKGIDLERALAMLLPLMDEAGLEYPRSLEGRWQYNTSRAQELALWAASEDSGATTEQLEAMHDRLFRAYQVENLDVYDLEVLAGLAEDVGLDGAAARAALERGDFRKQREAGWQQAMRAGVRGVPTYVVDGRGVVGAQPVELLQQLLQG